MSSPMTTSSLPRSSPRSAAVTSPPRSLNRICVELYRVWPDFCQAWPDIDQAWPDLGQSWPSTSQSRPNLARHPPTSQDSPGPKYGQIWSGIVAGIRRTLVRIRPNLKEFDQTRPGLARAHPHTQTTQMGLGFNRNWQDIVQNWATRDGAMLILERPERRQQHRLEHRGAQGSESDETWCRARRLFRGRRF